MSISTNAYTTARVIDDVKHYRRTTDEKFDLIVNDISAPYYLGTKLLHGRDFYELVKSGLEPNGILAESIRDRARDRCSNGNTVKILKGVSEGFPRY